MIPGIGIKRDWHIRTGKLQIYIAGDSYQELKDSSIDGVEWCWV